MNWKIELKVLRPLCEKVMESQEKHSRVNERVNQRVCIYDGACKFRYALFARHQLWTYTHIDITSRHAESVWEKRNDSDMRDKYEWYACRPSRKAEAKRTRGSFCFSVGSLLMILFDHQCSLFGSCFRVTLEFAAELLARRVSVPACHTTKPVDTRETSDFGVTLLSSLVLCFPVVSVQNAWDRVLSRSAMGVD